MTDSRRDDFLTLRASDFEEAHPFGFVVDAEGRVTLAGRGLAKRLEHDLPCAAERVFETVGSRRPKAVADGLRAGTRKLKLRVVGTEIVLRGQGLALSDGGGVAFIGSPQVTTVEQMARCRLKLNDFSASDATPDLLMSMQATRTALDDARELSTRLQASVLEAEAAVRAKGQFLAVMSHEIRTPMNGLGSMVDLLMQTALSPEQLELTQTINDCAHSLQALLDDALDLSKLDAESLVTEMIPVCLSEVIDRVLRVFQGRAKEESVRLAAETEAGVPEWLLGDPTRIRQVLSNLVSNAIKFSSGGNVTIRTSLTQKGLLSICVQDTGLGIAPEAQEKIFEPFTQADASITRQFGGTGLGLSIARGLARAMGGDLDLVHTDSSGTTFELLLPAVAADGEPSKSSALMHEPAGLPGDPQSGVPEASSLEPGAGSKTLAVLVVDDNPVNLLVARRLIEKLGARAETRESGQEALLALREASYDLVLLDLMMPVMSGIETAKAIRELPGGGGEVPIIAFSADVQPEARADALAAGMQGFLEKPVRLASMREVLASFARVAG